MSESMHKPDIARSATTHNSAKLCDRSERCGWTSQRMEQKRVNLSDYLFAHKEEFDSSLYRTEVKYLDDRAPESGDTG